MELAFHVAILFFTLFNLLLTVTTLNALLDAKETVHKLYGFAESVRKRPRG
jgi:hypothetical protein